MRCTARTTVDSDGQHVGHGASGPRASSLILVEMLSELDADSERRQVAVALEQPKPSERLCREVLGARMPTSRGRRLPRRSWLQVPGCCTSTPFTSPVMGRGKWPVGFAPTGFPFLKALCRATIDVTCPTFFEIGATGTMILLPILMLGISPDRTPA